MDILTNLPRVNSVGLDSVSIFVLPQALSVAFPRSEWVIMQAATAHYHLRNFDEAQEFFESLLERDPHRIEACAFCDRSIVTPWH